MKEAIQSLFSALANVFGILADWAQYAKEESDEALKDLKKDRDDK